MPLLPVFLLQIVNKSCRLKSCHKPVSFPHHGQKVSPKLNYEPLSSLQTCIDLVYKYYCHLTCDWLYSFLYIFPFAPFTPMLIQELPFHWTYLNLQFNMSTYWKAIPNLFSILLLSILNISLRYREKTLIQSHPGTVTNSCCTLNNFIILCNRVFFLYHQ